MSGSDSHFSDHDSNLFIPNIGNGESNIGGGQVDELSCMEIRFQTQLSSPKSDVIAELKQGDLLSVELKSMGPQVVVAVFYRDRIAGGLASPQIQKIRECILQGTKYEAKVISKNEGLVRIEVYAIQS